MKDLEKNKIDELFRKGLSESDIPFDEAHWRDMKKKLANDNNRRRDIILWTSMGGAAAMFIMAFAWWFVGPSETAIKVADAPAKVSPKEQTQSPAIAVTPAPSLTRSSEAGNNIRSDFKSIATPLQYSNSVEQNSANTNAIKADVEALSPPVIKETTIANNTPATPAVAPKNSEPAASTAVPATPAQNMEPVLVLQPSNTVKTKDDTSRISISKNTRFKPELVLSIVASPDYVAVKNFSDITSSFNGGILASVSISKKLSITTGAMLAQKRYETAFTNYTPSSGYTFSVAPQSVYAECRVLDIPLNLMYTFMQKPNYKLGVVAGASSYLMLTEAYDFSYQNHYVKWPKNYKVRGENNHFMGVANMALSYQRKLNNNIGVGIQPYVQVPLTGIGYGHVKLLSAGASFSLNVNVSQITGKK